MKKIVVLVTLSIIIFSCKNSGEKTSETKVESETTQGVSSKGKIYKGDFIYLSDAAVLKGATFIYGVTLDEKMHELANKVKSVKQSDFDMVPVAVKGVISKKPENEEGWPEILTITEIVMVGTKPSEIDIKLEDNK